MSATVTALKNLLLAYVDETSTQHFRLGHFECDECEGEGRTPNIIRHEPGCSAGKTIVEARAAIRTVAR